MTTFDQDGELAPTCGPSNMNLDQACIQILSSEKLSFLAQSTECFQCDLWTIQDGIFNGTSIVVNATYGTIWKLLKENGTDQCGLAEFKFGQFGHYLLNASDCSIAIGKEPTNTFLPILWAFLLLIFIKLLWSVLKFGCSLPQVRAWILHRQWMARNYNDLAGIETENSIAASEVEADRVRSKRRVKSLDAFRGLSIAIMIFVNYGGGGYYFFSHSPWNGITVADLVFPWFMWIMGVSLVISTQSQLRSGKARTSMALNVAKRSAILFFLGLVINSVGGHNDLRTFRIPGVLQRFSLSYLIVGLCEVLMANLSSHPADANPAGNAVKWWWSLRDIRLGQWSIALCLIGLHCVLTFCLPVPGCPTGYLGPGGISQKGQFYNCTGGAARVVDISIFGQSHIYQNPTAKRIYDTNQPYDPEGLLGTLTSAFIVILGVQCGYTLTTFHDWQPRARRWLFWSVFLSAIAGGLCGFSKDQGIIPLNKNLWSLSFVCGMGSMAFLLLTFMYLVIDVAQIWDGTPLIYAGMNSIVLYVGHEVCEGFFPFAWKPFSSGHGELLFMNIWGASLWVFISYVLYRKKMFLAL